MGLFSVFIIICVCGSSLGIYYSMFMFVLVIIYVVFSWVSFLGEIRFVNKVIGVGVGLVV